MNPDIIHRASWGFFAIRQGEFTCCHGTPETQHSAGCPYDKNFGPADFSRVNASGARGIDFHQSSMALRHGPGSKYAENLKAQAAAGISSAPVVEPSKPAKVQRKPAPVAGDLFTD